MRDWTRVWKSKMVSMRLGDRLISVAVVWGSVAASFIVEQVGLPVLTTRENGTESWNGASFKDRVDDLIRRI